MPYLVHAMRKVMKICFSQNYLILLKMEHVVLARTVRGVYILSGVLCGLVHDCILMEVQQYPIYCELENGDVFELLRAHTFPTRSETMITTRIDQHNRNLWIRERCNGYNSSPIAFLRLPYSKLNSNKEYKLKIILDIDANYQVNIKVVDLESNKEYNMGTVV